MRTLTRALTVTALAGAAALGTTLPANAQGGWMVDPAYRNVWMAWPDNPKYFGAFGPRSYDGVTWPDQPNNKDLRTVHYAPRR